MNWLEGIDIPPSTCTTPCDHGDKSGLGECSAALFAAQSRLSLANGRCAICDFFDFEHGEERGALRI